MGAASVMYAPVSVSILQTPPVPLDYHKRPGVLGVEHGPLCLQCSLVSGLVGCLKPSLLGAAYRGSVLYSFSLRLLAGGTPLWIPLKVGLLGVALMPACHLLFLAVRPAGRYCMEAKGGGGAA